LETDELKTAWNEKGKDLVEDGNYTEAIQAFNKSIELNPQNDEAWLNKGIALLKLEIMKKLYKHWIKPST
jgi:Flp pilus assembly protein TadD